MALNTYDSTKHHIGLKPTASGTNYGFMLNGGYRKEMQREALTAQDFGGSTDLIGQTPSMGRWTQDDFTGGMGQYQWTKDDAMFADCTNFMPDMQSRRLLSCPPMYQKWAFDPDTQTTWVSDQPKAMLMVGGSIYVAFGHGVLRQQIDTGTQTWAGQDATFMQNDGTQTIRAMEYDPVDDRLVFLIDETSASVKNRIKYLNKDLSNPATADQDGPATFRTAYGMALFGRYLIVQCGNQVYRGTISDDVSVAIDWVAIGRLPGVWKDSIEYAGQVYIISNDGGTVPTFRAHISAYNGDSIVPIASLPHSFMAKCMEEYGGRVYIGGTGTDVNGGEHYAELYELTGSSLRMVRSFSPETRRNYIGAGAWPVAIDGMTVHEGLLWFCHKGLRLTAYDQTSDAFYGASEIQSNTDLNFPKLISGRGRIWGFGVDDTSDAGHGVYRIAQPADSISAWTPSIDTSDFVYEPAVKKRWSQIKILSRYGPVQALSYSTNSGNSWTSLSFSNVSTYVPVYWCTADLAAITPTENIRFRIQLDFDTPDSAVTYHRELVAYTVQYAILDSGKWAWNLSINGSHDVEIKTAEFDESITQTQDMSDMDDSFSSWAIDKTPMTFTDLDGTSYTTQIISYTQSKPVIAPVTETNHSESVHMITLLQV
jgi:hypothetical protein